MITGGAITVAGPALGLLGTVIGMIGSFRTLGESGVAKPENLSLCVSAALLSTFGGLVAGVVGLVVLVTALIVWLCTRTKTPAASA
jgi:biopolymer transport protein ExbB/TolQ